MRSPENNSIIRIVGLISDTAKKTIETMKSLLLGTPGEKHGIVYSLLDHIMTRGPRHFREKPTSISLGRSLISPLVLLFSQNPRSK